MEKIENSSKAMAITPLNISTPGNYVIESSRSALAEKLGGPAETTISQNLLIINAPQIGEQSIMKMKEPSAGDSSKPQEMQLESTTEHTKPRNGLLAWIRRKKNRNKDDPDIHSHNQKSSN